jgi:hypothetical protein
MGIGKGVDGQHEGWIEHNSLSLLGHLNFGFNKEFAENLIKRCEQYRHK